MKKAVYVLIIAVVFASMTFAAENPKVDVSGSITAGYRLTDDRSNNKARFLEYRDLDDNPFGAFALSLQRGTYYLTLEGCNIGQDDQSYRIKGTDYRNFSGAFFYDETPHNLSFDARAPYSGIGSPDLQLTPTLTKMTTFDYSVERKEFGGEITLTLNTPFYLSMELQRREQNGLKPLGSGDYWSNLELPEPVDYTTNDLNLTGGYRGKTIQAAIRGYWSRFDNADNSMSRPYTDDTITLPPDNDYGKVAAELSWRDLPLNSLLALRLSYDRTESDISLSDLGLKQSSDLYRTTFSGDRTCTRANIALSSRPGPRLDTRIYYSYLDQNNDSSSISAMQDTQIFAYNRNIAGIDIDYAIARHTSLGTGYEFENIERHNRLDGESTTDHSLYFEVKNSSLDFLSTRIRYKRLERDAQFKNHNQGVNPFTDGDEWIKRYLRRYDVTDKSMDEIKLVLELYPLPQLDFGVEYSYQMNDYDKTDLGLTEDKHHAVYTDFIWRASNRISLSGFAGYEKTEADSRHRQFAAGESADINDLSDGAFNWQKNRDDDFWSCGVALDCPDIIKKLSLHCAWQYQDSNGKVSFSSAENQLADINQSDDYDLQKLEIKLAYVVQAHTTVTIGYLYEKYDADDLQFADYTAFTPTGTIPGSYLTGAYYDQDYKANVGYLMLSYNF
ncbi:MAG: MtrB/PioB family outer membrane beta-barrel protein [Deltaproteobacteria bacterium]|nr:MtrB/PioB family outer membrane beta-barrel protein [Deltaproteobacteria bacterium]